MHYYQFNIGDYSSHTSRLSVYEDLVYRRLLDLYYLNERPFNGCITDVARDIGMSDYIDDITYILDKFFTETEDGWCNKRCDQEIKAYKNKVESASKAGKASAEARRSKASEQTFNDRSTTVQPNIKHKPVTTNQEPITNYPESLNVSAWDEYINHRKDLKVKPYKPAGLKKATNWLSKQGDFEKQQDIVDETIKNNWTGIFELKDRGATNGQAIGSRKLTAVERVEQAGREYLEREARDSAIDITPHGQALGEDG